MRARRRMDIDRPDIFSPHCQLAAGRILPLLHLPLWKKEKYVSRLSAIILVISEEWSTIAKVICCIVPHCNVLAHNCWYGLLFPRPPSVPFY